MKQFSLLLALALFFVAVGFLLGQRSQDKQVAEAIPAKNQHAKIPFDKNEDDVKIFTAKVSAPQKRTLDTSAPLPKEECIPTHDKHDKGFTSEVDLNQITTLLTTLPTKESRASTLNTMFENNPRTPEVDSDSALTISDLFHREENLGGFTPQQISCHSNLCKVDLPALDASAISQLMEVLSSQLSDQKLKASHILLADDEAHGTTKLYVSLLPNESQTITEQQ